MECSPIRTGSHPRTLVELPGTRGIYSLSPGAGVLRIFCCSMSWKWARYLVIFFVWFTANFKLISNYTFYRAKTLQTPSNIFVVNLAICDFLMLKAPIFIYNSFNRGFASGYVGCQIFAFAESVWNDQCVYCLR